MSSESTNLSGWEKLKKMSLYIGIPIVSLFVILSITSIGVAQFYQNKMFPGVMIGSVDVSNLTRAQAREVLVSELQQWDDGVVLYISGEEGSVGSLTIPKTYMEQEQNLQYDLYSYNLDRMLREAYNIGRTYNVFVNVKNLLQGVFADKTIAFSFDVSEQQLHNFITQELTEKKVIADPEKAWLEVKMNGLTRFTTNVVDHQDGYDVNVLEAVEKLVANLAVNKYEDITVSQKVVPALITSELIGSMNDQVEPTVKRGTMVLHNGDISWEVQSSTYGNWLTSVYDNGSLRLAFREDDVLAYLEKYIEPAILREPVNAKFELGENGKVNTFKASRAGEKLLVEKTVEEINHVFFEKEDLNISLQIEETKPEVTTNQANDLGIREIIGIGRSNFAGSPANRRHNIAIGAASVNGTIIPPDGEFSLLKVLGRIDGTTGYKQELVIKGNETIPEYGGGLCQVGTTTFRGALDAGLDITERRNHSYRVSYYEPAGTDATIYDPAPDFRFKNDTANHVLILTKIVGNELVWEYWGTDDGRISEVGEPRIYNIIKPPPTKLVETEELAPGEKKCTERAHNGATADLTRKVTFADGTEKEETWHSVYRPWQEVCLIGKEPDAEPEESQGEIAEEGAALLEEDGVHIPQEPAL